MLSSLIPLTKKNTYAYMIRGMLKIISFESSDTMKKNTDHTYKLPAFLSFPRYFENCTKRARDISIKRA